MHPKLAELHLLLDSGYECVDIRSDSGRIEVVLARGASETLLTVDRCEAQELLVGSTRRSRVDRFLVRGPLRR